MNKYTKGIERTIRMKQWSNKRGGLPAGRDPFETGDTGVFDRRVLSWIASLRHRGLAQGTIDSYRWALLRYRGWLLRNRKISFTRLGPLLSRRRVQAFLLDVRTGVSATHQTLARLTATLKRFCSWLTGERFLGSDPLANLPTLKPARRPLPRVLPVQLILQLLEAPDPGDPIGIRDRAILELFYASAIRRNELRTLAIRDLDFHQTRVRIEHGKGGKQRIVPVGKHAFSWIRSYLKITRPLLAATDDPTAPLFVTGYGGAFSAGGLGQLVRRYMDHVGVNIPGSCHLLRHSAATHMMDRGAGLRAIQRILGHSRLDTTAIYTHLSNDRLCDIHSRCHPLGDLAAELEHESVALHQDHPRHDPLDLVD